ncbi:MAG TPA: hypothetical protein VJN69_06910 [Candidatus Acidoferrales bacterium]|nr:hypothetical protein [Candidatus Acidoferrales bacterium]
MRLSVYRDFEAGSTRAMLFRASIGGNVLHSNSYRIDDFYGFDLRFDAVLKHCVSVPNVI